VVTVSHRAVPIATPRSRSPLGWLRTSLPGRGLPLAESMARRRSIRSIAIFALAVNFAYLFWRTTSTVDLGVWWVSVPLLVLEVHAAIGIVLFAFSLWDVDSLPRSHPVREAPGRIAVLIPTFNESVEILIPTIAAAVNMRIDHETWVLDDGDRPAVARLAEALGARYLTRSTHEHAKAGNVNHALGVIEADFIGILDADHVASDEFLVRTLGYFDDPVVALVQTPQEFYNTESFEHASGQGDDPFHEQTLFYRVIQPGKNRWGAAFWCGTGAVVRLSALRDVGGVATETITEDIHTTIRFHRRGWRTVYHNEVLARGLAASDAATYQLQRLRWGTGAMQVLRRENPLFVSGLTLRQRLAYAATLLGWFDAWRSLGYILLPVVVLLTGAVPIRADPLTFIAFFGSNLILGQIALRVLSRGAHRPMLSVVFELVRMSPNIAATLTLISRRRIGFRVSPKGRTDDARRPAREPRVLVLSALASIAALGWFAVTLLGRTPTHYEIPWAAYATAGWLVLNVLLLVAAMSRVRALRFAGERRASHRFETVLHGTIDGVRCDIHDLSLTGARVEVTGLSDLDVHVLAVPIDGVELVLEAVSRSTRRLGSATVVGIEFLPDQDAARARLALGLFETRQSLAGIATPDSRDTRPPAVDVQAA
jgi:cellulose synthase/poly-beta-1,6-N-acetylglucosamine synthase-like glycosyltransferase